MQRRSHNRALCAVILLVNSGGIWARAGDLNPPAGPVAPTMKTLTEIEPRTPITSLPYSISSPGSYYLTGNLTGVSAQNGISITASDVTLDLNGFQLIGVTGSLSGIAVPGAQVNIAIGNGTIQGWGAAGLDASLASNCQVERLRVFSNGGMGLQVDQGSTVVGCAARLNGLDGIVAGNASAIRDCSARNNGGDGVRAGAGSTIAYCTGRNNVDDGIQGGPGGTIVGCAGSANDDDGINIGAGGTVVSCSASENSDDGIQADIGCTISNCTANLNVSDGIVAASGCHILGNTSDSNTAGGVHASGSNNRIDGNNVTNNGQGVAVDAAGNLIVRNSARGNGANYVIVAGNKVGTISSDPTIAGSWDNFAF